MRKFIISTFFLLAIFLVSCSQNDSSQSSDMGIVGKWKLIKQTDYPDNSNSEDDSLNFELCNTSLTFRDDQTCFMEDVCQEIPGDRNNRDYYRSGVYLVKDNVVTLTANNGNGSIGPTGKWDILKLNITTLIVQEYLNRPGETPEKGYINEYVRE